MKIADTADYIRQQVAGRFTRPEDGKEPFAHVNDKKLASNKRQHKGSVYINDEKVLTLDREPMESHAPQLFDFDAGLERSVYKISPSSEGAEEEKSAQQDDVTGQLQGGVKQHTSIDEWV